MAGGVRVAVGPVVGVGIVTTSRVGVAVRIGSGVGVAVAVAIAVGVVVAVTNGVGVRAGIGVLSFHGVSTDQTGPAGSPPICKNPLLGPPGASAASVTIIPFPSSKW